MMYAMDVGAANEAAQLSSGSLVVMSAIPEWPDVEAAPVAHQPEKSDQTAGRQAAVEPPNMGQAIVDHQEPAATESPALTPVWEVDKLAWPGSCEELYASQSEYFQHAGQKLLEASQQGLRVLAIASSRAGEGCTTLAMCLARAVAAAGARVSLLDANLRNPSLGRQLGLDFSHGWQNAVADELPLREVTVLSIADRITLIPLAPDQGAADPSQLSAVLRQASSGCDLLILDVGSVDAADAGVFKPGSTHPINAAIVVRDLRSTSQQKTLDAAGKLKRLGIEAVGIAENFAPQTTNAAA